MKGSLKNPAAAWPFPVRTQPVQPKAPDTEAGMCTELEAWCKAQGLPFRSADELRFDEDLKLTATQVSYLGEFLIRWNAMLLQDTVPQRVRKAIATTIGYPVTDVTDEKTLSPDLNMDSLDRFQLSIEIEDEFGIAITDAESAPLNTVGEIVALVQGKVKP